MPNKKPIIGLLGAPGSGKTTVADQLESLGCAVIRADVINHELLEKPEIINQIEQWFGPAVLDSQGNIDRAALGDVVFSDRQGLEKLNHLLHPLVKIQEKSLLRGFQQNKEAKAIVLDVPLLAELGQDRWCHALIYVFANKEVRTDRLRKTRGWSAEKTKNVENSQLALDSKAKISEYRVCNNSSISDLVTQTAKILALILEKPNFPENSDKIKE